MAPATWLLSTHRITPTVFTAITCVSSFRGCVREPVKSSLVRAGEMLEKGQDASAKSMRVMDLGSKGSSCETMICCWQNSL